MFLSGSVPTKENEGRYCTTFKRKGYLNEPLQLQVDAHVLKECSIRWPHGDHTVLAGHKWVLTSELVEGVAFDNNPLSQREQENVIWLPKVQPIQEIVQSLSFFQMELSEITWQPSWLNWCRQPEQKPSGIAKEKTGWDEEK